MRRLVWLLVLVGCGRHLNPEFCAAHPDDPDCGPIDAQIDAPPDSASATCAKDEECASNLCLPEGTCAPIDQILYASATGAGIACTKEAMCTLQTALSLATPARHIVLLGAGLYSGNFEIKNTAELFGRNAVLSAAVAGATVTIDDNAVAQLNYMTIRDGSMAGGIACTTGTLVGRQLMISNNTNGVVATCDVTLERSLIVNNTQAALVLTSGAIDIHSNFITNNGTPMFSGAIVDIGSSATGSFTWNTVAYNQTVSNRSALRCMATQLALPGNLVTDNLAMQVTGTCSFADSYTAPGTGRGTNDVKWVNPTANDFHLTAASSLALDLANGPCDLPDFDGDPRPAGTKCDFGADELHP